MLILETIPLEQKHLKGWWDGKQGIVYCRHRKTLIAVDFATISNLLGELTENSIVKENVRVLLNTNKALPQRQAPAGFATQTQSSHINLYQANDFSVQIITPFLTINLAVKQNPQLLQQLTKLFKDLPRSSKANHQFLNLSLHLDENGWAIIHNEKDLLIDSLDTNQTAPYILDIVMTVYYREMGYKYAFHGSAVQWHEKNLFFPAPSGSGKSTLFAHFVHDLNATPFSDEVIALDNHFDPMQMPFPMTLKTGSWPLFPNMEYAEPEWQRTDKRTLKYSFLNWSAPLASKQNFMFFPRYMPEHTGGIQKIGPCKAIFNLGFSGYELAQGEDEQTITQLLEWLNDINLFEMVYPSSSVAERLISEAL